MPNHIHGIVIIRDAAQSTDGDPVGATGRSPLRRVGSPNAGHSGIRPRSGGTVPPRGPTPASLGAFVAGLKSAATTRINALRGMPGTPVWQRNYYEHVIRTDAEYRRILLYVHDNPRRWADDEENPANMRRTSAPASRP